jgi:CheY-like chemotaxis protein
MISNLPIPTVEKHWHDIRNTASKNVTMKTGVGIFEDDKIDLFLYQQTLEKMNPMFDGIFLKNMEEGIEAASKGLFEILIVDVHFFGDNIGLDILQRLRRASPKEFIAIAVTPMLQEGDLERILAAGFNLCLEKPYAFEVLSSGKSLK